MTDSGSIPTDSKGFVEAAAARPVVERIQAHVTTPSLMLRVWATLMCLTVITVLASWVDFGQWNLLVAIVIAVIKASLVALFFMHLRWDRSLHSVVFLTALLVLGIFIGIALLDTTSYHHRIIPGYAPAAHE